MSHHHAGAGEAYGSLVLRGDGRDDGQPSRCRRFRVAARVGAVEALEDARRSSSEMPGRGRATRGRRPTGLVDAPDADRDLDRRCPRGCSAARWSSGWRPPGAAGPRRRSRRVRSARPRRAHQSTLRSGAFPRHRGRRRWPAAAGRPARGRAAAARPAGPASAGPPRAGPSAWPRTRCGPWRVRTSLRRRDSAPCRYSSEKPRIDISGVRSSWQASATNRRIPPSRRRPWARKARLDVRQHARSATLDSRPTSVSGRPRRTRRDRSPAAIAAAVRSTRARADARLVIRRRPCDTSRVASRPMRHDRDGGLRVIAVRPAPTAAMRVAGRTASPCATRRWSRRVPDVDSSGVLADLSRVGWIRYRRRRCPDGAWRSITVSRLVRSPVEARRRG